MNLKLEMKLLEALEGLANYVNHCGNARPYETGHIACHIDENKDLMCAYCNARYVLSEWERYHE